MAEKTVYRVVPREDGWAVEKAGADRAVRVEATKKEALDEARGFARNNRPSEVVVHREDGTIQDRFTYHEDGTDEKDIAYLDRLPVDPDALMEEVRVRGDQLVDRIREIVAEGNARRVIIKKDGKSVLELPLSVGVGGAAAALILSPVLAALGAFAALVTDVTVLIERVPPSEQPPKAKLPAAEKDG
ncbi:MAG: DUF4342 domain-containing protein [Rhodothermales bacterium]|nr:DUF4342 domain-containing protein [Rhodothermales bacterium]